MGAAAATADDLQIRCRLVGPMSVRCRLLTYGVATFARRPLALVLVKLMRPKLTVLSPNYLPFTATGADRGRRE